MGEAVSTYDSTLFYRNDKKTSGADPFILDDRDRTGYYYLYTTSNLISCYRSKDMMTWEKVGNTLSAADFKLTVSGEEKNLISANVWAPEVVYDNGTYYMFFSATPTAANTSYTNLWSEVGYHIIVATSTSPTEGFKVLDVNNGTERGEYYAKYALLEPAELVQFAYDNGLKDKNGGYLSPIDPHPFVDADGTKYLLWSMCGAICGIQMDNWTTPNWNNVSVLVKASERADFEAQDNAVNEGAAMIRHVDANGTTKYYLTYSMNSYTDPAYQVGQAVSDSVLGTYRKLSAAEGGLLLSSVQAGNTALSGTGHNIFVTVGDQTYIVYHRHDDVIKPTGARNHAIDEVKWITIQDKDGNDLDVMYVNGPTSTVQPAVELFSEYKNIADEATVTGSDDARYLTDGLLSLKKNGNSEFLNYIKETNITKKTTFTFRFHSAKAVKALMIYNSKDEGTCFTNISKVTLVCEEDGEEVIRYIDGINFSSEYYTLGSDGEISYITPGSCAYAQFDEMNVTSIRITVEVPEGQESVGISEIKILGK